MHAYKIKVPTTPYTFFLRKSIIFHKKKKKTQEQEFKNINKLLIPHPTWIFWIHISRRLQKINKFRIYATMKENKRKERKSKGNKMKLISKT